MENKFFIKTVFAIAFVTTVFFPLRGYFADKASENAVTRELRDLIKRDYDRVDSDELVGASVDKNIYMSAKSGEDEYVLLKIKRAKIAAGNFVGEVVFELPNGELYSSGVNGFVPEVILRNGEVFEAVVIDNAIGTIKISDEVHLPIKFTTAEIINGKITGLFSGYSTDSGSPIAGRVSNDIIETGYVVDISKFVPALTRAVGQILVHSVQNPNNVLGAQDGEVLGQYVFRIEGVDIGFTENFDRGTFSLSGIVDEPLVLSPQLPAGSITQVATPASAQFVTVINEGDITSLEIADLSITTIDIADNSITGAKILNDTIRNEDIADSAINSAKIEDNTITPSDLANSLNFDDGDFIDLSAINHDDSAPQGLRLPNTGSSPTNPSNGEGYIAWDSSNNTVLVYNGGSWEEIGGSVDLLATDVSTSTTSSVSGLEVVSDSLSLLRGCADSEILKWNDATGVWECSSDVGAGGAGISTVQENNANVVTSATQIDFSSDFDVTDNGAGEAGIALANSSLTITAGAGLTDGGSVSLGGSTTLNIGAGTGITVNANDVAIDTSVVATLSGTQTLTNKTISAGSNTITGLTVSNFTSANISQWTNNSGYLTTVDISDDTNLSATNGITLTGDQLSLASSTAGGGLTFSSGVLAVGAGTGITVNADSIEATLGTSISNSELDNDTVNFDKISDSLTLDAETTISAGSALNLLVGNNVTFTTTGTGAIIATDLNCTDCIGATEISDLTLGTHTSGNYVATITSGNGVSGTASGEGSTPTLALAALTSNWSQTGAFDIVLDNASSELQILESTGGTFYGTLDVGDLSANATYTFAGTSGTVLTSANVASALSGWDQDDSDDLTTVNYSGTLDSVYVNTAETPASGDISGSFSIGFTIGANSVALGTDTTGNYVAGATSNGGLAMTGTEGGTLAVLLPSATNGLSSTTSSGSGLELTSSGLSLLQGCSDGQILKWDEDNDVWACDTDTTGGGSGSLDDAYNNGATITVDASDVLWNLSDATNDYNFVIDNTTTGDIASAFAITTTGSGGTFGTGIDLSDNGLTIALALGSNSITVGGATISSTEFARLDGKDAALVDTNDAVSTAITGTGTLTSGATGAGFTLNFGTSTLSGNITGANISGIDISDDTNLSATDGITLTGDQLTLASSTAGDGLTYSSGVLAVGAGTGISVDGNSVSATLGTSIANSEIDDDTITLAKIADTLTLDGADLTFASSDATNDYSVIFDNSSTGAIDTLIEVTTSGTGASITTAIDLSDADIATALALGSNDITVGGATISSSEFALLDSGIALSELTDSGTLTAGTVDINGGAIDGVTIGANSAGAGTFTTGTFNTSITIGGDTIDEFVGTGLQLSSGDLQTTLGTSIANSELDDDTINFDKISDSLTLDAETTISAGGALSLLIGNNTTLTVSGTGAIVATDLSCTNCIGPTEISELTLGTDTAGNYIDNVTAGNNAISISGSAGEGWEPAVSLSLQSSSDGLSSTTSSGSGLEITSGGLTLLQGCGAGQVLKWNETSDIWECSDDNSGGGGANSFETINAPSGTDPVADSATDTLNLAVTGSNFTVTGDSGTDTITFDISESALAGAGIVANGDALDVQVGNGLEIDSDAVRVNQDYDFTLTGNLALSPAGSDDLDINLDADSLLTIDQAFSGTTSANSTTLTITNASSSGTQNGLYIDNAASTGTTEALLVLDNSDSDTAVTSAVQFIDAGGGFTNLFLVGATAISSSEFTILDGGINYSELTDSGTLTATTVDINGGVIDGVTIGANSAGAGTFTTGTFNTSITMGGDTIDEFVGTGLQLSDGDLQTTLGTSISNSELDDDTVNFDKIADSLTLDAETTISASGALNLLVGNNVTLTTTGTGALIATDLTCTNCIGPTEISDLTLGTDTAGNYVAGATANSGLTMTGTEGGTLGIAIQADKGLEVDSNGLSLVDCSDGEILKYASGAWGCDSDDSGVSAVSLDDAYNEGSTITVDASDILFDLNDATNDYGFVIDNNTNGTIATAFEITTAGGVSSVFTTAIDVSDADIVTAIAIGSNDITVGGATISSTEFARLDGKDAALVDTNDAVSTAITGTGTLTSGATGAGFTLNFGTSTLSGNITGANISGIDISDDTNLSATDGITLTGDQLTLASSTAGDGLTYSSGVLAVGAGTGISVDGNSVSATLGTSIANSEIDDDTITLTKVADSLTLDADLTFVSDNATLDNKIIIDNASTGEVAEGIEFTTSGTGASWGVAIDLSDADIATALALGNNDVTVGGATISSSEFALLDSGVALSELTDSGTLTAGTVDINGGAIDGVTIGASSAGAGTFTTLTINTSLTMGGDTIDEFVGTGLQLSDGDLQTTLGTSISNSELDDDTVNFDKISDSLTLDAETTISAGGALSLLVGNNATLTTTGTGAIIATDLTCTNCIGPTEIADLTLGTDTAGNYVAGATSNAGLTMTGTEGGTLGIALQASKGLEVDSNGLSLIDCQDGEVLKYDSGAWGCDTDDSGVGAVSLDDAYNNGATITVDAADILFDLNDATNDYGFVIDNNTNGTIATALEITTAGGASSVFTTAIDVSDADIVTALAIGSNDITVGGATISSTEFARLDGIDAALVDTNDAVSTAITGTGTLTSGATGAGFTLNFGTSTLSGNITGANISGIDISDDTNLSATDGITLTGDQLTLASSAAGDGLTYSSGVLAVGAGTGISVDGNSVSATLGTSISNSEIDDDTITLTKVADTLTLDGADLTFASSDATNDYSVIFDNSSTGAIDTLIEVTTSGSGSSIATAIDVSDSDIGTAIAIGSNDVTVGGVTISSSEFALLDSGIALSELTDSGTLTAGTVDINGGAIDGVTIGGSSAGAGTFTTLTATGTLAVNGDLITSDGATLTINAGGTVDIQDGLTVDSATIDAGNLAVSTGTIDGALTLSGSTSDNLLQITLTNSSSSGTQNVAYFDNAASTGTTESLLVLDNSDDNTAVTNGIQFIDAGGGFTNLFNVAGTLISSSEFNILDGGINYGELTNSGTLTVTTIDVNGGAIDGTAIGASSASSGAFTTLTTSSTLDVSSTIQAGSSNITLTSSEGYILHDALADCADGEILKWATGGGRWGCASDDDTGATLTLDGAYENGGTIELDATDLVIELADATNDYGFVIDNATTGAIANALEVTTTGSGGTIATGIVLSDDGIGDAIDVGGNDITGTSYVVEASSALVLGDSATGTNSATVAIFSSDWEISTTGAITGVSFDANGSGNSISNIENADLADDTLNFNKIASSLTLDEETTIAAGGALNLLIGNNVTLTTTGTGAIVATDLSCSDCIGGTEIDESSLSLASTDLTDTANIAYLDAAQTFTGANTFDLAGAEDLQIDIAISGTTAGQGQVITLTNSSSSGNQYGLVIDNAASTGTTEALLRLDNSDSDTAVTNAIEFVNAGGGFTNLFNVAGTAISVSEFTILDSGIALSELTDSGTLTAGTVDINGGAIDGTTIGANSAAAGTFTTGTFNTSITMGGDTIDEFVGTGLQLSDGDLQTTLGTSISNSEIDDDTINFDKISASLTLDEETTISAGGALSLLIGNNVTLTTTGTGAIVATDLSCTNCIGPTEIADLTLGTDTAGNYVAGATANSGLAMTGTEGGTLGIAIQADKGLEVDSNGLSIIDCSDGEILKYASGAWGCDSDDSGVSAVSLDDAYNEGTTITVDAADVLFDLSDSTNDYGIVIDNNTNATIDTALEITTAGGGSSVFTTAIDVSDADIVTAIAIGSNDITVGGATISSTEFARLDGKDAALVDTNDAVTTAITGTGTLTAGATGSGFTLNFGSSTLSGNISGSNIDESTLVGIGNSSLTDDTINFDKISASLTLDQETTISAGSALNLLIGNNVALGVTGTGTIVATDLSCTNCIGPTEITDLTLGTDTAGNYVAGATSNAGLTLTGTEGGTLGIALQASKGLEVDSNGLSLIDCQDGEVLKYDSGAWGCDTDDNSGAAQTPWAQDIDADGFDLVDLSNLLFRETTGAPAGTDVGLYRDNSGDLSLNVLTAKTFNIAVNGTDEYNFSSTGLSLNSNNLLTGNTTLSASELDILDSGIALSELTDSGTLTAGTVDINGGAIDGVTIGANSAAAGTFTTVTGNTSVSTPTLTLTGTGTINGLDAVDSTGEDTIEALIFDDDAQDITGVWEVQDDVNFALGSSGEWAFNYNDSVDDQLLLSTSKTSSAAITDPMFEILVDTGSAGMTADQQVFGVARGSQASNTPLFTLDEDGDAVFAGTVTATFSGSLTGNVTGDVTGNVSGTAATVTGAAQTAITSLGTLTALQVDNLNLNGNTLSSTAGTDLLITPLAGQQIVLDGTIEIDAGVVTGATSITSTTFIGNLTGNADTVTTNANLTGIVTSTGNATAIADGAISYTKLADGVDGNLLTWDANGDIALVATGTAGQVLTSNGAGAAPTFQTFSGANTALSNLASVAINTSLISDTDNTDALGSSSIGWSDLFLGDGAVINFEDGDVTLTHSTDTLTLAGGTFVAGTVDINGGAIDGTTIGGSSAAAGTFTTLNATSLTTTSNIEVDGTGNAFMILDRNANTNFSSFQFQTNNSTVATVGLRNDSTENLYWFLDGADAGRRFAMTSIPNVETVFNDDGGDMNFRIEGDTISTLFVVDAGDDTIAINTSDWDITAAGVMTGFSFDANGTGNSISNIESADILDDSITEADLNIQGTPTDEYCLTYETGGGALLAWQECGGGSLDDAYNEGSTITVDASDILFNLSDSSNDYGLVIDNATNATIDTALEITTAGGGSSVFTTAIDLSDAGIVNALAIGDNDITVGGVTISATEFALLDNGIALSELTNSGTLTAGTVDINGGAIDGTAIGASSTSSGAFTTISASGAIAANGGITFDSAADTVGAHTLAGNIDANSNLIVNIGNSGTDFLSNGGLTLANAFTVTTGGATITDGGVTIASGALAVNSDSITSDGTLTIDANGAVVLGGSGNTFTFSESTGPAYAGNARPARSVTLSPEYSGAVLTGDGSNNTGTMTSDFCENGASADLPQTNTGVCNTSGDVHNYYSWTTSQGSAQDYDIWIRWRVPDNFSAWASNPIDVYAKRTDATNNAVQVYVYDTAGTLENSGGTQVAGTTWTSTTVEASFAGTYTAGGYMTIRIVMTADTGGDSVQVGEINLDYLSSN